jgi:hypothetical protein
MTAREILSEHYPRSLWPPQGSVERILKAMEAYAKQEREKEKNKKPKKDATLLDPATNPGIQGFPSPQPDVRETTSGGEDQDV